MKMIRLSHWITEKQYNLVKEQFTVVETWLQKKSLKDWQLMEEENRSWNSKCPHCGSDNIIDRIADVNGNGGFFSYTFIHTSPVNHCSGCGHEWRKFTPWYFNKIDLARDLAGCFQSHFKNNEKQDVFLKGFIEDNPDLYAETIWYLIDRNGKDASARDWEGIKKIFLSVKSSL